MQNKPSPEYFVVLLSTEMEKRDEELGNDAPTLREYYENAMAQWQARGEVS